MPAYLTWEYSAENQVRDGRSEEMKFWREWHIIGLFCEDKVSLGDGSKGSKPGMEIVPGETDGG